MGWTGTKAITIGTITGGPHSDFVLPFVGTYAYLAHTDHGGDVTSVNGYDIVFTSDRAGTSVLKFERVSYDHETGACEFWVLIPSITTGTVIYLQYGNSAVTTDQQDADNTWGASHTLSYHTTPHGIWAERSTLNDSSGNGNYCQNFTRGQNPLDVAGKIGRAQEYDGATEFLSRQSSPMTNWPSATGPIRIGGWFKLSALPANVGDWYGLFTIGTDAANQRVLMAIGKGGSGYYINASDGHGQDVYCYPSPALDTNWHKWDVVIPNATRSNTLLYLDGTNRAASVGGSGDWNVGDAEIWVGVALAHFLAGILDEWRVQKLAPSADRILTEYQVESDPSSFYTIGDPSPMPVGARVLFIGHGVYIGGPGAGFMIRR